MTALKITAFGGEIPRTAPHLLPEGAAQQAINCEFSSGELCSIKGPAPKIATTQAVRGLFTDDGVRFFTWPEPTRAYRSPTIDDTHGRIYFANTSSNGVRVALANDMKASGLNPGQPTQQWAVGVARPAVPPTVEVFASMGWQGDVGVHMAIKGVLTAGSATIQEFEPLVFETVSTWTEYLLTMPADMVPGSVVPDAPANPSGDTWIAIPGPSIAYFDPPLSWQQDMGGEEGYAWQSADSLTLNTGAQINALGKIKPPYPSMGSEVSPWAIFYDGKTWAPTDLYAHVLQGDQAALAELTVQAEVAWKITVFNPATGVVYYEGTATGAQEPDGRWRVWPQYDSGLVESIAYVTTFENDWGEESAPSDPVIVEVLPWQDTKTLQEYTALSGGRPVVGMNLYRTFGGTAEFIKANESPRPEKEGTAWAIWDALTRPMTTVALVTQEWDPPPAGLRCLTYCGNGFFVGAKGKDLYFSEPYRPHAWPYIKTMPTNVVGIVPVEGGVLVTTQQQPYFVYGARPDQVGDQELNADQAGVSEQSITRVEGSAVYVSNDGLVMVSGGQADIAPSQQYFTRELWRQQYRAVFNKLVLSAHDGSVMGLIDGAGSALHGFMLKLSEGPDASNLTSLYFEGDPPIGAATSAVTDIRYLLYPNGFAEYGLGSSLEAVWRSRDYVFGEPVIFGAGKLRAWGQWALEIRADDQIVMLQSFYMEGSYSDGEASFRLPAIGSKKRWSVALIGRGRVRGVELGASFAELKNV